MVQVAAGETSSAGPADAGEQQWGRRLVTPSPPGGAGLGLACALTSRGVSSPLLPRQAAIRRAEALPGPGGSCAGFAELLWAQSSVHAREASRHVWARPAVSLPPWPQTASVSPSFHPTVGAAEVPEVGGGGLIPFSQDRPRAEVTLQGAHSKGVSGTQQGGGGPVGEGGGERGSWRGGTAGSKALTQSEPLQGEAEWPAWPQVCCVGSGATPCPRVLAVGFLTGQVTSEFTKRRFDR